MNSVYFICAYIPETSGMSLEDIQTQMEQMSKTTRGKDNTSDEAEALLASQRLVQQQLDYGSLVVV